MNDQQRQGEQGRQSEPVPQAPQGWQPPVPIPTQTPEPHTNSGGVLVLQWLTYAFWLWFGVSVSILAGVVLAYVADSGESDSYYTPNWGEALAYPLAAVLIMTIIAFVTDMLYSKHEPAKKTGAAKVIMLLHVVPFVLIAIGALITLVFIAMRLLMDTDSLTGLEVLQRLLTPLVVAVLMALAAVRAFFGTNVKIRQLTWLGFGLITLGFMATGIFGPVMTTLVTKNDRLVEETLPTLAREISSYASDENKLPETLKDLKHEGGSNAENIQRLIDKDLVTYKPGAGDPEKSTTYPGGTQDSQYIDSSRREVFYYQLCATYAREKGIKKEQNYTDNRSSSSGSGNGMSMDDYRYSYSSRIQRHPAGEMCYDLYATGEYKESTSGVELRSSLDAVR